jgi:peptidoglycan hydrolase-like amidase
METKPAIKKSSGELITLEQQVVKTAFSEKMGGIVASRLGVPAKQIPRFQLAHTLLPLNRAKECIDTAYFLASNGYSVDDIHSWLQRYERLTRVVLPKWAKKKSRVYLREAYNALEGRPETDLIDILYEFKGFMYGVFCRTLMERYGDE